MANRILIVDENGTALFGLDGHHGALHAAEWAANMLSLIKAEHGIDCVALEFFPAEGGDATRRGVIGELHRLRAEIRSMPDGRREVLGLHVYPPAARGTGVATVGAGRGLLRTQAAATPAAVRGGLRVIAAPESIANPRAPVRIRRGRDNPPPGQPRTPDDIRTARKAQRAARRRIAAPGSTA